MNEQAIYCTMWSLADGDWRTADVLTLQLVVPAGAHLTFTLLPGRTRLQVQKQYKICTNLRVGQLWLSFVHWSRGQNQCASLQEACWFRPRQKWNKRQSNHYQTLSIWICILKDVQFISRDLELKTNLFEWQKAKLSYSCITCTIGSAQRTGPTTFVK